MTSRLGWYVAFSAILVVVLLLVGVPQAAVWGYLAIATAGLVLLIRDERTRNQAQLDEFLKGFAERKAQELNAKQMDGQSYGWYDEVEAAQTVALARGATPFGIFTTYNPYWSLSYKSLIQFGLTDEAELDSIYEILAQRRPLKAWEDALVRDLMVAGYAEQDALVRLELFDRKGRRFGV